MRVWRAVEAAMEAAGRCALVTLADVRGSSPREAGARLVVRPDGGFVGTIGGGTLEWRALAEAVRDLARVPAERRSRIVALGPDLGQCCGGRVTVLTEIFDASARAEVAMLAAAEAAGPCAVRALPGAGPRLERWVVGPAGPIGPEDPTAVLHPDGALDEVFGERPRPVVLFGAGHVGKALVLALAPLPFAVEWVDPRPGALPPRVPANVAAIETRDPEARIAAAADGAFVVVATHSHALDLALVAAALKADRFAYVGVIGSATKRARFESRLAAAGIAAGAIAALVCPIGGGASHSKLPAVIAAMTAAELIERDARARPAVDITPFQATRADFRR